MIALGFLVLLMLLAFGALCVVALFMFVANVGRARREPRPRSRGWLGTAFVLAIAVLMLMVMGLFTSRMSYQRNAATVERKMARDNVQVQSSVQFTRSSRAVEPAQRSGHEVSQVSFLDYDGAPPEPLELARLNPAAETGSVVPATAVSSAAPQPAWLGETPKRVGPVYRTVVVSDPYVTKTECDEALDPQLREVALHYVDDLLGPGARRYIDLDMTTVRTEIARDEYVELLDSSVGPMQRVHVLMEFDDPLRAEFRQQYQQGKRQQRLYQAGGGAVTLVAILGVLFGYLTIDTATRGFYTRRLQLAATAAILLIVVVGMSLNRAI